MSTYSKYKLYISTFHSKSCTTLLLIFPAIYNYEFSIENGNINVAKELKKKCTGRIYVYEGQTDSEKKKKAIM